MCRRAAIGLEPTPHAAGAARHFVANACQRWGIDAVAAEISLAVSELVTNSVVHARTHIEVELCVAHAKVEVCVRDNDPRQPVLRPVRLDLLADLDAVPSAATTREVDERDTRLAVGSSGSVAAGRGLLIVDAVAEEWGVVERVDGKEVWLTLPVTWTHADECVCDASAGSTPSGRGCVHMAGPWDANSELGGVSHGPD
jgi:two-component sensor histidine kinase